MVGSEATDRHLHHHLMDGDDGLELEPEPEPEPHQSSGSGDSCSICLDSVSDDGDRSRAKLRCGHEFHLDCIGSAFNMKGSMQCPNCRKVEKGRWLYANGSTCSFPEFNMEDWIPDEDPYDLSYTEMPFRVHWCPFGRLARLRSSFEDMEYPSTTYNGFPGHHAIFAEHATASSVAHSYIAYLRPIPPASSNSVDGVEDPSLNHHWSGPPGHSEIFDPQTFSVINSQHHNWGHQAPIFPTSSSHNINGADPASVTPATQRSTHGESDAVTRSRSFLHPFIFGHGSSPGTGSSFVSSIPHHPSSNTHAHERMPVSHSFHHQQQASHSHGMPSAMIPGMRRLDGQRGGVPGAVPPLPQLDHASNFYLFPPNSSQNLHEAENAWERERLSHFPGVTFDRDSGWHSFHQAPPGGNDPGTNRYSSIWHRHWPWRN